MTTVTHKRNRTEAARMNAYAEIMENITNKDMTIEKACKKFKDQYGSVSVPSFYNYRKEFLSKENKAPLEVVKPTSVTASEFSIEIERLRTENQKLKNILTETQITIYNLKENQKKLDTVSRALEEIKAENKMADQVLAKLAQ